MKHIKEFRLNEEFNHDYFRQQIIDAYIWIRKNNNTIPDDVLDFMKLAALEKLDKKENYPNLNQIDDAFYFGSKSNKMLTDELPSSSNAKFKVYEINGNEAKFIYIGPTINENWIDTVCTISNSASDNLGNKTKIITTQHGIVRNDDGKWIVIKPATIRYE